MQDFVDSHAEARRASGIMGEWTLIAFVCKSPFVLVLRFAVSAGLMIIPAHDRRHLWQAERVKESSGYPGA